DPLVLAHEGPTRRVVTTDDVPVTADEAPDGALPDSLESLIPCMHLYRGREVDTKLLREGRRRRQQPLVDRREPPLAHMVVLPRPRPVGVGVDHCETQLGSWLVGAPTQPFHGVAESAHQRGEQSTVGV